MKKGIPGTGRERKSSCVGPDYPEERYRNPFAAGLDSEYGNEHEKTLCSPANTPGGPGVGLNGGYDELWEGK